MFGCLVNLGLNSTSIPGEVIGNIEMEEDLINVLKEITEPGEGLQTVITGAFLENLIILSIGANNKKIQVARL